MIFTPLIPLHADFSDSTNTNKCEANTSLSKPSGFKCIDDMFDGNGYPSNRIINIHSESIAGSTLLVLSTMV